MGDTKKDTYDSDEKKVTLFLECSEITSCCIHNVTGVTENTEEAYDSNG